MTRQLTVKHSVFAQGGSVRQVRSGGVASAKGDQYPAPERHADFTLHRSRTLFPTGAERRPARA